MPAELLIKANPAFNIYAWLEGDTCQVKTYIKQLVESDNPDGAAMVHLFDVTSQHGPPSNPQKFLHLQGAGKGLVEFKARGGTRVLGLHRSAPPANSLHPCNPEA